MSEKVDHSFTADDIPDIIKTKEDIEKNMTNEEIQRTEQLHADIRDAASSVPGTEVTSQPGLIQEVIGNIPGTPVSPPAGYGGDLHPPEAHDPHREMIDVLHNIEGKLDHVLEHMHRQEEHHHEAHCCQDTASAGDINLDEGYSGTI